MARLSFPFKILSFEIDAWHRNTPKETKNFSHIHKFQCHGFVLIVRISNFADMNNWCRVLHRLNWNVCVLGCGKYGLLQKSFFIFVNNFYEILYLIEKNTNKYGFIFFWHRVDKNSMERKKWLPQRNKNIIYKMNVFPGKESSRNVSY